MISRVEMARYAASSEAVEKPTRVQVFNLGVAVRVLTSLRQQRQYPRGLADYEKFVGYGLEDARMHNIAGILASSIADVARAEVLYLRAASLVPNEVIYKTNAIAVQLRQERISEAIQTADGITAEQISTLPETNPNAAAQYAIARAEEALMSRQTPNMQLNVDFLTRVVKNDNLLPSLRDRLKKYSESLHVQMSNNQQPD